MFSDVYKAYTRSKKHEKGLKRRKKSLIASVFILSLNTRIF